MALKHQLKKVKAFTHEGVDYETHECSKCHYRWDAEVVNGEAKLHESATNPTCVGWSFRYFVT